MVLDALVDVDRVLDRVLDVDKVAVPATRTIPQSFDKVTVRTVARRFVRMAVRKRCGTAGGVKEMNVARIVAEVTLGIVVGGMASHEACYKTYLPRVDGLFRIERMDTWVV